MFGALWAYGAGLHSVSAGISPDPKVTPLGQAFTVNLRLDTATPVRGVTVWISHDTSRLSFGSATQGALFNGTSIGWWRVNTTDTPGTTRVECIIFGSGQYVTGPGNLLNLTYTATSGDFTTLHVTGIELYHYQTGLVMPDVATHDADVIIAGQVAYAKAKCWLEGPYVDGRMNAGVGGRLPLASPYAGYPQSVATIPEGAVDWALIQLRATPTGNNLYSQSVFIFSDGTIRSAGKPYLIFIGAAPGNYYLIVRHRNHLAAMSAAPMAFAGSGVPALCDLTSLDSIYGRAGMTEVAGGIYALAAGDADQDGGVYPSDRNNHWRVQTGMSGYLSADFNLDGNVFPSDLNNYWRGNSGMASQVPEGFASQRANHPTRGGIQYHLANAEVVDIAGESFFEFDVLASGSQASQRLGTGILLINYNPAVFGNNLQSAGNITITRGSLLVTQPIAFYGLIVNDNSANRVAITFEYLFTAGWGNILSAAPQTLVHVRMKVRHFGGDTGISFAQSLMAGQQYTDDNSTLFYPVLAEDTANIYLPLAPADITICAQNGILSLGWQAQPNCEYTVYSASSLALNDWMVEASGLLQPGWQTAMATPSRFYRVTASGITDRRLGE